MDEVNGRQCTRKSLQRTEKRNGRTKEDGEQEKEEREWREEREREGRRRDRPRIDVSSRDN